MGEHIAKKIHCIPNGLFAKSAVLNIGLSGRDTNISLCQDTQNVRFAEVVDLDSAVDAPVTFLKMDIEGAEQSALRGAEKTIKKHRPILAVCVYHKVEDIWEIPTYIHNIMPDYKLYLRHYTHSATETVCYGVPPERVKV
jgi:hypothetical protein